MIRHITIKLYGRVQNVGFRANTEREANKLSVKGTVTNLPDGTVLIEAEAHEDKLKEFLDWCKDGPQHASVDKLESKNGPVQNYQSFSIV